MIKRVSLFLAAAVALAALAPFSSTATATPSDGTPPAQHPLLGRPGMPYLVILPSTGTDGAPLPPPPPPPPPPPARPAPGDDLLALQASLQAAVDDSGMPGRFAIAVTDFATGATVGVDVDRLQRTGCIVNLFAIIAALRDVEAGRYSLGTVDALIRQTIWASDATTAHTLYGYVGGGDPVAGVAAVREMVDGLLGAGAVQLDHPPAYPGDTAFDGSNNLASAAAMNRALQFLHEGKVLGPDLTAYLLDAMTDVKPGLNYLTAALPPSATVSHKNGFYWDYEGWVDNDTGIVAFSSNGQRRYAITYLSEAVPEKYSHIPLAQQLVRIVWDHYAGH